MQRTGHREINVSRQKRRFKVREISGYTHPMVGRLVRGMVEGNAVAAGHPKFNTAVRIVKVIEKCLTELARNVKVHESAADAAQT
jgi:hypothetical protein